MCNECDQMVAQFHAQRRQRQSSTNPHKTCFWIVWRASQPSGFLTNPMGIHNTLLSAQAEATRLAIKEPNINFYVSEAKEAYKAIKPEVQMTVLV